MIINVKSYLQVDLGAVYELSSMKLYRFYGDANKDRAYRNTVIVVSPDECNDGLVDDMRIVDRVNMYIRTGLTNMEAIKKVAKERKIPKNEVYKEYHGGDK